MTKTIKTLKQGIEKVLPNDVRKWPYYPIIIPLNEYGEGPVDIREAVKVSWEVWNRVCTNYGTYEYQGDAISKAIELTLADPTGEHAYD